MTKVNNGLVMGAFSHNGRVEFSTYYVRCRSPTLVERQPTHRQLLLPHFMCHDDLICLIRHGWR